LPILFVVGAAGGYGASTVVTKKRVGSAQAEAEKERTKAKKEADKLIAEGREEAARLIEEGRKEEQSRRREVKDLENRLVQRESTLDRKLDELDKRAENLRKGEDEVESLKNEIRDIRVKQQEKLEKIAKLSRDDAAEKLMQMTERDIKNDLLGLVNKLQNEAQEDAEERAALIITTAMERMSSEVTAERTITSVKLEDEEMKGRIIGKEGRNIQSLQRATGVDIMVDDTPGYVVLSSFDPVRREIAKISLNKLIADGRIHPTRIEELVAETQKEIDTQIKRFGEEAVQETGVRGLNERVVNLLGRLHYRTSYSQNVLRHSIEVAFVASTMAELTTLGSICRHMIVILEQPATTARRTNSRSLSERTSPRTTRA